MRTHLEALVTTVHFSKKVVGLWRNPEEQSVETHPLGTSQSGGFHVVGTFDDGNIQFLDTAITATVLERRQKDGIGMQVDDALHIGIHTVATIGDGAPAAGFVNGGQFDVLQVADTADATKHTQIIHQSAVDGRVDD